MATVGGDIETEGVTALYEQVLDELLASSAIEPAVNLNPFFNPVMKNEIPDGYTRNNNPKFKYVPFKSPREMLFSVLMPPVMLFLALNVILKHRHQHIV
jgi:hypothetical protein